MPQPGRIARYITPFAVATALAVGVGAASSLRFGPAEPPAPLAAAAAALDAQLLAPAPIGFSVHQSATFYPRPGGAPLLAPATAADASPQPTDSLFMGGADTVGGRTLDRWWTSIVTIPAPVTPGDVGVGPQQISTYTTATTSWTDQGSGWTAVPVAPGLGIDRLSFERIPALLRGLDALIATTEVVDGRSLLRYDGRADAALYPSALTTGAFFSTRSPLDVRVYIDPASNRLVRLEIVTEHLDYREHRLEVSDRIEISDTPAVAEPSPVPSMPAVQP